MKKYFFIFLILILPVISLSANVNLSDITLKQAVDIAKAYFDVPSDFTNFTFNYNTYGDHENWNLTWSLPQINSGEEGSLNITINALNGEVEDMSYWSQSQNQSKYAIPKITREDARKIAQNFLSKIDSTKLKDLMHIDNSNQIVPLTLPQSYIFGWERIVNGIPFSNDFIQISVDAQTGRIISYQMKWSDQEFPSPSDILTPKQAKLAFLSDDLLKLEYYSSSITEGSTAILAYALSGQMNGAIDAVTGRPVELKDGQQIDWGSFSNTISGAKVQDNANQDQIVENYKFISEKQAIENLKKIIEITSNLELTSADLSYNPNDKRIVWNLYWWNNNEAKADITGTITSIFSGIDAINGSLDHLYVNYQNPNPNATIIGEDEAKDIAEVFLKKAQPEYFSQIKYDPQGGYKPQGSYNFVYDRIVKGISFPADSLKITVSDFGLVTSYSSNWSKVSFESTDGIIPLKTANEIFLDYRPLSLNYIKLNDQNNSTSTIILVYEPEIKPFTTVSNLLNAKSGQMMGSNGKDIDISKAYHFNDISASGYATELSYLGQSGIFGEYGKLFMPYEDITVTNFLKDLESLKYGANYVDSLSPNQIMDVAKNDGLISNNVKDEKLDGIMLSEIIVRFLGLKIAAKTCNDRYTELAYKLGIISSLKSSDLNKDVTRLEAALSILKAIKILDDN